MQHETEIELTRRTHIEATFQTVLAKLPKSVAPERVTLRGSKACPSLRVYLDGSLVDDFAFTSNFGWMPYESSFGNGPDGDRVRRAMKAAMKATGPPDSPPPRPARSFERGPGLRRCEQPDPDRRTRPPFREALARRLRRRDELPARVLGVQRFDRVRSKPRVRRRLSG
jgi:hypothetical protein